MDNRIFGIAQQPQYLDLEGNEVKELYLIQFSDGHVIRSMKSFDKLKKLSASSLTGLWLKTAIHGPMIGKFIVRPKPLNFTMLCILGLENPNNVDDYIDKWRADNLTKLGLHEYLGLSHEDYTKFIDKHDSINKIISMLKTVYEISKKF